MSKKTPPEPPYDWRPLGTKDAQLPRVGDLIAWRHEVWRVLEITLAAEVDWSDDERMFMSRITPEVRDQYAPKHVIVRPARITGTDVRDRDWDVSLRARPGTFRAWRVYPDEHYPVCAQCHEPMPCREEMGRREGEKAMRQVNRYSTPGVCPACNEPITSRQRLLMSFEDNIEVPGGAPVTFHLRAECRGGAIRYEQRWAAADPGNRHTTLSCPGHLQRHSYGTECSEGPYCPGEKVGHRQVSSCDPAYGGRCERCADDIKARTAAGDWTIW